MRQPIARNSEAKLSTLDTEKMSEYGITKKSIDHFFFGGHQYTNFHDALAQAKRASEKTSTG